MLHYQVVMFAISTTGQGDFPTNARLFWRKMRNARLEPGCLSRLQFTTFGLGDSSYPQYAPPASPSPINSLFLIDTIGHTVSFIIVCGNLALS